MKSLKINPKPICKECGKEFETLKGLHLHLRSHKMKMDEYYMKHFPKKDLQTGKPIKFKNLDDYKDRDFNSIVGEFNWIEAQEDYLATAYILDKVNKRKERNGDSFFYSYVEWKTARGYDYVRMINNFGVGFFTHLKRACLSLGLEERYDYNLSLDIEVKDLDIWIDTREQLPLLSGERNTLSVGDYCVAGDDYNSVHIERKSLGDYISTLTGGIDRFERECELANSLGLQMVILVEESFENCFKYRPPKRSKQKVTGENAFHNLRRLMQKYKCIQPLFVKNRNESVKYMKKIFSMTKEQVSVTDLQFLYDLEIL